MRHFVRAAAAATAVALLLGPAAASASAQQAAIPSPTRPAEAPRTDPASPFMGGVPHGEANATPLPLSLREAIDQGLSHNLGVLLQEQGLEAARGSRWEALSGLLPDVAARVGDARRISSLAEFGFTEFPGLTVRTVGPYNVFDTRLVVSQPVLDMSALYGARAGRSLETAARHDVKNARELVVLVVANLYLSAIAADTRVDTARASLRTADALLQLTSDLKESGIAAGIDVLRARVQQQTERQRVVAAENQAAKARLQLARAIGLPPGQSVTLTDVIPYAPLSAGCRRRAASGLGPDRACSRQPVAGSLTVY